jgi:uncharacterized membrane protein
MYWILFVMGAVTAVVIALVVGGLATPRQHVVVRGTVLNAPAEAVWSRIRDIERLADWRSELEDVTVEPTPATPLRWSERSTTGSTTFEATIDEPPHRFGARATDADVSSSHETTWQVTSEGDRTRVTLTARGETPNPISRFVGTHFIGHSKPVDRQLHDLARSFGQSSITIEEVGSA